MACLVLHSGQVTTRDTLFRLSHDRASDEFVFDKDVNEVNDYALRWGFEEACTRAEIAFGETVSGGIIWHDLRRTFATRLRANGVHEYDIGDLLGPFKTRRHSSLRSCNADGVRTGS